MKLKQRDQILQLIRKGTLYLKKNYIDLVLDAILVFLFDILTGLIFIRIALSSMIKIITKELGKGMVQEKIKSFVNKNLRGK